MALIKFLKRKKEQIDQAIPDFNIRQRAGQAVKSVGRNVGRAVSNVERSSQRFGGAQRNRLDSALAAQRQRQAEQANLRREREAEARARKLEQSQRRLDDLRAKQEQRNADREFKSKMAAQGIGGGRQFRKELFNIDNIRKSTGQALYENKPLKIVRGAADFVAPITTGRNLIRTTGQAFGAGIEEFGLRKEQKAIDKENKAISKISDPKEALRRSQANSEKARKLTMLREEKQRTVNVPKVLADTGLFAADTALSATGAKAAIKAGKPVVKQVFKEAVKRSGQRAGIGAGFGAGTSISEGERDVKQIAKQAGISAAANVALGGVIDVAPKIISKGAKTIQTALEQPKFKPGFASTKGKIGLKPKQPKTEAPKDIPGFTPAPEAKPTKNTRIEVSGLKVKSQAQPTKNIIVKSTNPSVPSLTEADVNQIARNTKSTPEEVVNSYNVLSNRKSETTKDPIRNIQASLTSFIRDPKTWENKYAEPAKVLTAEDLPAPTAPKTKTQQQETKSAIDKAREQSEFLRSKQTQPKVEEPGFREVLKDEILPSGYTTKLDITTGKQMTNAPSKTTQPKSKTPAIKLATKKSSEELAREAMGVQDTQKVVREKVFEREAEIPATPQQRTQFEINQANRDAAIPEIKAVSKSEAERIKRERVIPELPEINTGRTQAETDRIIREKVFGKEPALKPAQPAIKLSKPETFEDTITRVASESAENAKKQPISPETPPVARVSTKEDISVSPEVKIKTRSEQITEASVNVKDEKTKAILISERKKDLDRIEAEYKKATGKTYEEFKMEHEAGTYTPGTEKLHQQFDKLSDTNLSIAEKRHNVITPKRENYIYHITEENANKVLKEGPRKSVGDILYTPGFSKKRTGALKDYTFGKEADLAHFAESIGPTDPVASALFRIVNSIKNTVVSKKSKNTQTFEIIKDNFSSKTKSNKKLTNEVSSSFLGGAFRSIKDRASKDGDKTRDFRDKFLNPFLDAETNYSLALQAAEKLSFPELSKLASKLGINSSNAKNQKDLFLMVAGQYKKQFFGPAAETFIKNVANVDTKNSNTINLINDIAETYMLDDIRKRSGLDRFFGFVRQQYALGAIGASIGNALQNTLETKKVLAATGIKNTAGALKDYITGIDLRAKYGKADLTNQYFESQSQIPVISDIINFISPKVYTLQNITEAFKDKLLYSALERKGISKGLQGADLKDYVITNFQRFANKMGKGEDIGAFTGSNGRILKTAFQFQQYSIKDTMALKDAFANGLKGLIKDKKINDELSYALAMSVMTIGQNIALGGIGAYGISKMLGLIEEGEEKDGIIEKGLLGQPGFGSQTGFTPIDLFMSLSKGDVIGPGPQLLLLAKEYYDAYAEPEGPKRDEKLGKATKELNRNLLLLVVPGINQFLKTTQYNQARDRGYFETTGKDKNVANLVTEDTWGMIRGYLLGESYDPERQKYFDKMRTDKAPNLGKEESAIFKQLKEKGGIEKAKEFFSGIMSKRETDKALKDLEEGVGITKPEGMTDEKWIETQATNEVLLANNMVPDDVLVEYYGRNIEFGKAGSERTKNETKVFNLINTLNNEDKFKKLSDEQKDNIESSLMEKAGIAKDTVEYYNKAKNTVVVKYQIALEEIAQKQAEDPNFDVINYLVQGRKKINTQVFASQEVLKMLEQDDIISEDQYKVLNKMNFLYLDGEFKDRSVAVKLKGKGKKPPKITLSRLMAGQQRLSDTQKIKGDLELVKLKSKPRIAAINLRKQTPGTVLRLAPVRKVKPKKLTIKNIRVK